MATRVSRNRRRASLRAAALLPLAAALFALAAPRDAEAARTRCPGTFRVLHDDHVGRLALPKGRYSITTLASGRPNCARAARLFADFLQDYDGVLPRPWRVSVADRAFVRAPGVGFHVRRLGRGGGGGGTGGQEAPGGGTHPDEGRFCPATFRVLHDDRIGSLRLRAGPYWIVLLRRRGLGCAEASRLFTRFLESFHGNLPRPWRLDPETATFRRDGGIGFRVKPVRRAVR